MIPEFFKQMREKSHCDLGKYIAENLKFRLHSTGTAYYNHAGELKQFDWITHDLHEVNRVEEELLYGEHFEGIDSVTLEIYYRNVLGQMIAFPEPRSVRQIEFIRATARQRAEAVAVTILAYKDAVALTNKFAKNA